MAVFAAAVTSSGALNETPPAAPAPTEGSRVPGGAKSRPGREHYLTAQALARSGLYQAALAEIDFALSANSKKTSYHNMRGYCLEHLHRYNEAIQSFNQALFLDPHNDYAHRHLLTCEESKKTDNKANRALGETVRLEPARPEGDRWLGLTEKQVTSYKPPSQKEFEASYWEGIKSFRAGKFDEAALSLAKAVELRPADFDANLWRGMALVRLGKFVEAIPNFEKAHERKPEDKIVRLELFGCYLVAQQPEKALAVFPILVAVAGGALSIIYLLVLGLLLPFSVPIRAALFPGLLFSIVWAALFWEGQVALFFLFAALLHRPPEETAFISLSVAALPVILVAATAFGRQPWGGPFRWPPRLGTWSTIGISLLVVFLLRLVVIGATECYVELTHKQVPLQYIVPIINGALKTNPFIAWSVVVVVTPIVEEILFRGLLYGALEKRWGFKGAIVGSAILFAMIHLQFVGFLSILVLGVLFAWARHRTNSLGLPILLHGLNNALAMVMLTFSAR